MPEYPFHYDPPKLRISDSEIVVQKACLRSIAVMFRHTRVAAVPNGQKRTVWQAQRAKAEGMSSGFPDLVIVGPAQRTAYCEIKAESQLTLEQKGWLNFLVETGHFCGVFRSDQTLCDKLREWGFR
jgi:hypothetical protein